jgi:hypothetical protein
MEMQTGFGAMLFAAIRCVSRSQAMVSISGADAANEGEGYPTHRHPPKR